MDDIVGVLGGMGPAATVLYLERVVDLTRADRDQDHVNLICLQHSTVPDRTDYILDKSAPNPLPDIAADVRILTGLGVRFIALPCNTAHYFLDEIQADTDTEVLNMIELTVAEAVKYFPSARNIGVLGTRGTMRAGIYSEAIERAGRVSVNLSDAVVDLCHDLIYQFKAGHRVDAATYLELMDMVEQEGAQVSLIACTELSALERKFAHNHPVVDALDALARETIRRVGKQPVEDLHVESVFNAGPAKLHGAGAL